MFLCIRPIHKTSQVLDMTLSLLFPKILTSQSVNIRDLSHQQCKSNIILTYIFCSFSGDRYQTEAHIKQAAKSRKRMMDSQPELQAFVTSLPTTKVPTVATLTSYIRVVTSRLPELLDHYGSLPHRRLRKKVKHLL